MTTFGEKRVAITGIGQTAIHRQPAGQSGLSLTAEACLAAIADAGLDRADIDGLSTCPGKTDSDLGLGPVSVPEVQSAMGLRLNWFSAGGETAGQFGAIFDAIGALGSDASSMCAGARRTKS